ncbi:MAG TPA: HYR domain-containing protein [Saprospiraceae bacterium]|nr:HYR domain-containing protein [Saprospiraceae bacterium]
MKKYFYKKRSFLLLLGLLVGVLGYSQNFPDTLPSLPAGKSVTITYQVQVDPNLPVSVTEVSEQDSVSYIDPNNFLAKLWSLSDDPATGAALDPTITSVIACDLIVTNCNSLTDPNYDFSDVPATAAERFADAGGMVNMAGDMPAPCGTVTITDDFVNPGECGGTALVTFTITDDKGTATTADDDVEMCSVMITVVDDEAPTFTCPEDMDIMTTGINGCEVDIPNFADLITDEDDNCDLGGNTIQQTIDPGLRTSNGNGAEFSIGLRLEDAEENTKNDCVVVLTVVDVDAPTANCPSTVTVNNASDQCGANVTFTIPAATDNCDASVDLSSSPSSGSYFAVGTTEVTVTATDDAGETDQCTFNVVVNDNQDPSITGCPGNIVNVNNDAGQCGAIVSWIAPTVSDNCPGATISPNINPGTFFPVGTTQVSYTATDAAGNSPADCTFSVTVEDTEAPVANCQTFDAQLSVATGEVTVLPSDIDNNSTDNCIITTYQIDGMASIDFTCADIGPQTVMLTVIDFAGLQSSCTANVNVQYSTFCPDPTIANSGGPTIADPCSCSATPGYFDEEVVITGTNPGEAWAIQTASGFIDPNDFPNEYSTGELFADNGDGTYSLVGMHESGVGYSLVAISPFYPNVELPISNTCYLPELANADTSICSNEYLGIVLDNVPPSVLADSFHVTSIDLGDAVQINGITANMGSTNADLLADMVFEYTGQGSTMVAITVVPYNEDNCPGEPLVIMVSVEKCPISCADGINVTLLSDCTFPLSIRNVALGQDIVNRVGYYILVDDGVFNGNIIDGIGTYNYAIFNRQNENVCWGTVTAEDKTPPTITCPDVTTIECFLVDAVLGNGGSLDNSDDDGVYTGEPTFSDNCSSISDYQWSDRVQLNDCEAPNYGRIFRRFMVEDEQGITASCEQTIVLTRITAADFSFANTAVPDETIFKLETVSDGNGVESSKWVHTLNTCDADATNPPATLYPAYVASNGETYYLNEVQCNLTTDVDSRQFLNVCADGSYKEERSISVFDWCAGTSMQAFEYVVKVGDFDGPELADDSCAEEITFINVETTERELNNGDYDHLTSCGMISTGPMNCTASINTSLSDLESRFGELFTDCGDIEISVEIFSYIAENIGGIRTGDSTWIDGEYTRNGEMFMGLPTGKHALVINATDGCYNSSDFILIFEVMDLVKPVMRCDDELRVTLVEGDEGLNIGGYANVTAIDVDEGSWDNCQLVSLKVRRDITNLEARADWETQNGNLEADADYTPWADLVEFFCADINLPVKVELQGTDAKGNTSICWLNVGVENGTNYSVFLEGGGEIACNEAFVPEDFYYVTTNGLGCFEADIQVDVDTFLDQCGFGYYEISISDNNTEATKNASFVDPDPVVVNVVPLHDYWVKFPQDDQYFCANEEATGVTVSDDVACDLLTVYEDDEIFRSVADPNACYKILRTYKVINWCEYDGESLPVVVSRDWDAHNASSCSASDRVDGDRSTLITGEYNLDPVEPDGDGIPGDEDIYVIIDIDNRVDGLATVYYDNDADPTNTSTADLFGDDDKTGASRFNEGYWWAVTREGAYCSNQTRSSWYDAGTDIDGNDFPDDDDDRYGSFGYWQYTQHIIVYDDSAPGAEIVLDEEICSLDNQDCDANVPFTINVQDACSTEGISVKAILNGLVELSLTGNANKTTFTGMIENGPIGEHTITVTVNDGCGNVTVVSVDLEIKDCKAPAPICHEDILVELMPVESDPTAAMAEVWATDLIASDIGDCSGQGPDLINGLPKVTTYSINRLDSAVSVEQIGLVFDCEDANDVVAIEIHAWDEVGNHDYCVTSVLVQDNNEICNPQVATGLIAGAISTEMSTPIEGVEVGLSGNESRTYMTDANGEFGFEELEEGYDYSVIPGKNVAHRNGVSTFDLVLIQKHILGTARLNSPYKIIAADANSSKSVTTLDLIQVRKLILNLQTEFPDNTSWRFIDADYNFPDPLNPWLRAFPEVKNINNLERSDYANFVGVKIGDVNTSAKAYNTQDLIPRRVVDVLNIQTEEVDMVAGNTYNLSFRADLSQVAGYQFTLELDKDYVQMVDIEEGIAKTENFGVFAESGLITTSFHRNTTQAIDGEVLFRLRVQSKTAAKLSEVIRLTSRYTSAEAYNVNDEDMNVQLVMDDKQVGNDFALDQNVPNPFDAETKISFQLPEAMEAVLEFKDISGRTTLIREGDFTQGYNEIRLRADELPAAGVYFYTLHAGKFTATRKMILFK